MFDTPADPERSGAVRYDELSTSTAMPVRVAVSADDRVCSGGFRVLPGEVEMAVVTECLRGRSTRRRRRR